MISWQGILRLHLNETIDPMMVWRRTALPVNQMDLYGGNAAHDEKTEVTWYNEKREGYAGPQHGR